MKKILRFLKSMKLAILLLMVLAAACVVGSVIPQRQAADWYLETYGLRGGSLILGVYADDVFHSTWFLVLTVLLLCDLLWCNLSRIPGLVRRTAAFGAPDRLDVRTAPARFETAADPEAVFRRLSMPKPKRLSRDGKELLFSVRGRAGLWGAWVTHLGIFLLIVGFALGQATKREFTVSGVPGQTLPVGDTGYRLRIDDFDVAFTESGSPKQFSSALTLLDPDGKTEGGTASVNHPASLGGFKIYQNSTGTAARVTVTRNGELVQDEILCAGDYCYVLDTPMALIFEGYLRQGLERDDGVRTDAYAWSTWYDGVSGETRYQPEGEAAIQTESITVRFSEPQSFTLLVLKQERFGGLALLGGLVTLLGLVLSFYFQPKRVWAERSGETWTVCGACSKGGSLFYDRLREAVQSGTEREETEDAEG